ncbi:hypothetical protein NQZ68_019877 [Dissostichus eleginoides]|nr:hypothetical protein NQZ68_019877 [Dissostichus eleginoides]
MRDSGSESGADGRGASQRLSTGRVRCRETLGAGLEGGETPLEDGLECGGTGTGSRSRPGGPTGREGQRELVSARTPDGTGGAR